ncbi:MAG: hypothetical protein M1823_008100, partial [Watsoniomyces obsoletus]
KPRCVPDNIQPEKRRFSVFAFVPDQDEAFADEAAPDEYLASIPELEEDAPAQEPLGCGRGDGKVGLEAADVAGSDYADEGEEVVAQRACFGSYKELLAGEVAQAE